MKYSVKTPSTHSHITCDYGHVKMLQTSATAHNLIFVVHLSGFDLYRLFEVLCVAKVHLKDA